MKTEMQILWGSTTDHKELKMLDCHLMQNWRFTTWQNSNLCLSTSVVVCTTKQIGKAKKAAEKKDRSVKLYEPLCACTVDDEKTKRKTRPVCIIFC